MSISVLVVEDHPELRTLIQNLLAPRGYEVRCAATVEEAMKALDEMTAPCIVLWDPVTLQMNSLLIAQTVHRGVHVATIPVSVTSTGQAADGSPTFAKRLTSREAVLGVVSAHCPGAETQTGR
jgi:CheY-like chemotaxis protein